MRSKAPAGRAPPDNLYPLWKWPPLGAGKVRQHRIRRWPLVDLEPDTLLFLEDFAQAKIRTFADAIENLFIKALRNIERTKLMGTGGRVHSRLGGLLKENVVGADGQR